MQAAHTFEMLSTAARYVAQLMLPGGLGLRSTALTSSSISGIHDAIGGTALTHAGSAVLAIPSFMGSENAGLYTRLFR